MKLFTSLLVGLFCIIGAHVPKAFSLLYLALLVSWLIAAFIDPRPLIPLGATQLKLFRSVQALVFLFSITYPLAMLHFGFWRFGGRDALDAISAFLLPNGMLWWGFYMVRRDLRLFNTCLLSYCFGGLIFLTFALFKTSGIEWYAVRADPGSLFMPWGSEISMNVRSIEQNGILNIAFLPVGLLLFFRRHFTFGVILLVAALLGVLAVLPLSNGRLWILSLLLASWPLFCVVVRSVVARLHDHLVSIFACLFLLGCGLVHALSSSPTQLSFLCDERFGIYQQSLSRWHQLISGGRLLNFSVAACGQASHTLSLNGRPGAAWAMLHSVPLDVVASVGLMAALPMLLFLIVAFYLFATFAKLWSKPFVLGDRTLELFTLWSVLAVVLPQWLFQPLIYSDGLLYYLSYALVGALLVLMPPFLLIQNSSEKNKS